MRIFTLAAGLATGYVLGSRAGREKYEQIVAQYQKVSSHPSVVQAQEKTKQALSARASGVITKLDPTAPDEPAELPAELPAEPPAELPDEPPVSAAPVRPARRPAKSSSRKSGRSAGPLA